MDPGNAWESPLTRSRFWPFSIIEPETCTKPYLAKIVTLADRLSSGERESRPEEEESGQVREALLTCMFTKLGKTGGDTQEFPMLALTPDLVPGGNRGLTSPNIPSCGRTSTAK